MGRVLRRGKRKNRRVASGGVGTRTPRGPRRYLTREGGLYVGELLLFIAMFALGLK